MKKRMIFIFGMLSLASLYKFFIQKEASEFSIEIDGQSLLYLILIGVGMLIFGFTGLIGYMVTSRKLTDSSKPHSHKKLD